MDSAATATPANSGGGGEAKAAEVVVGKEKEEDTDTTPVTKAGKKKSIGRPITRKEDEGFELVFDILFGIRYTVRSASVLRNHGC